MKADYRGMHNGAITDPALKKSRSERIGHAQRRARKVEQSKIIEYGHGKSK